MNDFSLIDKIVDNFNKNIDTSTNLITVLSVFIGLNIIITLLNVWTQFRLKTKDKSVIAFNLRETKKVELQEDIYKKLDKLALIDPKTESDLLLSKIQILDATIRENKIHIPSKLLNSTNNILDYFKEIMVDYRKKDYKKEIELFDNFCKIYNS